VLSGLLAMSQRESERDVLMFHAHAGDFVGTMSVLTGEPSVFTVRAKHHTRVAVMSSGDFYE
jgi:CRP-like cAMP-binding protein